VKPATPLALGLVGNVDHCRRNTNGVSTSAMARQESGARRAKRRLAQNTAAVIAQ
jgi:hypothetical protein